MARLVGRRYGGWLVLAILVVLCAVLLKGGPAGTTASATTQGQTGPSVGRWQVVVSPVVGGDAFLVDTATGRVWSRQNTDSHHAMFWWEEEVEGR